MKHTLDQFEVEPNTFYSGSYTDPIFSGSIFTGNRRVIAAQTSGSNEFLITLRYSDFTDFSGPNRNRSLGIGLRFRHFFSVTERYEDTILPEILDIFRLNGGLPVLAMAEAFGGAIIIATEADADAAVFTAVGKLVFTTFGTTASYESNGTKVSDPTWFSEFPFQGKYRNLSKAANPTFYRSSIFCPATESYPASTAGIVKYGLNDAYPSSSLATVEVILPRTPYDNLPNFGPRAMEPVRFTMMDVSGSVHDSTQLFLGAGSFFYPPFFDGFFGAAHGIKRPAQKQLVKLLFGFGDNYQGVPIVNAVTSSLINTGDGVVNGFYASSIDIRGWRYGCINGFPQFTSCIFRNNRYGQFRDMLEQRKYSKFFDPDGFTSDGKNNGKKGSGPAVTTIRFVSGSQPFITASNPGTLNLNDSGMYDFQSKAGQPFHDQ